MTAELVKKVTYVGTYLGKFGYLNSSCIRKSIILMFLSSSKDKFTLLLRNSVTDVSVGFRPPCWCPSAWAPAWRRHTNIHKFGYNVFQHKLPWPEHASSCKKIASTSTHLIFARNSSRGQILRALLNWLGPFHTPWVRRCNGHLSSDLELIFFLVT